MALPALPPCPSYRTASRPFCDPCRSGSAGDILAARAPGEGHRKPFPGAPAGGRIEIYSQERYYTLTGHRLDCSPATVNERQQASDRLYAEVWEPKASSPHLPRQKDQASADDDALIGKALKAKLLGSSNRSRVNVIPCRRATSP
jgi:hypothetical protein